MVANTETYRPTQEDEAQGAGLKYWYVGNGKIRYGDPESEEAEERESLVGLPKRIGMKEAYKDKDGVNIRAKFRLILERVEGEHEGLTMDLNGVAAKNILQALLLWRGAQFLRFTATRSDKKNSFGTYSTFIGVSECVGPHKWTQLRTEWSDESQEDLLKQVAALHPSIYKDFVYEAESDEPSPYDALSDWLEANGWQRFAGQGEYLAIIGKALKGTYASAQDVPQSFWGGAVSTFEHAAKKNLIPDSVKLVPDVDEFDPFADE